MKTDELHSIFDEVGALHAQMTRPRPQIVRDVSDPAVPDDEAAGMAGVVATGELDADLFRARQIGQLGGDAGSQAAFSGNQGTSSELVDNIIGTPHGSGPATLIQVNSADPETLTVVVAPPVLDSNIAPGTVPFGIVSFGAGGVQATAEIDLIQGCVFQVHASFLKLDAKLEQQLGGASGNSYRVGAYVTRHDAPKTSKLVRSTRVGAVAPAGGTSTKPIKPMATEFQYVWSNSVVTAILVRELDKDGNVLIERSLATDSEQVIPIISRATQVEVVNNDGAVAVGESFFVFTIEL